MRKGSRKWKKKLLIIALPLIMLVVGATSVATGVSAVVSFLFKPFISEAMQDDVDVDAASITQLIKYVSDDKIFTEKMLNNMMIDRKTLLNILKEVNKANASWSTKTKQIECRREYVETTYEERKIRVPKKKPKGKGSGQDYEEITTTVAVHTPRTEYFYKEIKYSTKDIESAYPINWQIIYAAATFQSIQKIVNQSIDVGETDVDVTENDETYDGDEYVEKEEEKQNPGIEGSTKHIPTPYDSFFQEASDETGVPVNLLKGMAMAESSMNPTVVSSAGCIGLMQISKDIANTYGCADRCDPRTNILAGARYYASLLARYDGDIIWAACGYNYGPGNVEKMNGVLPTADAFKTYINNILKVYTGKSVLSMDYAKIAMGDYCIIGSIVDGKLTLTIDEIKSLIDSFKPTFTYNQDMVRDSKKKYSYEECKSMPNAVRKSDGGNPNSESGEVTWYEPSSKIDKIELPYLDITYTYDSNNVPTKSEYLNMDRWYTIITKYWPYYDQDLMEILLKELPGGDTLVDSFEYKYGDLAKDYVYTGTSSTVGGQYGASGTYEPLENVSPSIKIPSNAGGMSIPLYLQYDMRWDGNRVGTGTMQSGGCSFTSLSMVFSYLNNQAIYPNDILAWAGDRYFAGSTGQSWSLLTAAAKQWGIKCEQGTVDATEIVEALRKGYPVIVSTTGSGTTQTFTKGGHFIVLRGLTEDGKVLVNDPNDNTSSKQHYLKAYDPSFIVSECTIRSGGSSTKKGMWVFHK